MGPTTLVVLVPAFGVAFGIDAAQEPASKAKNRGAKKAESVVLDPSGRPEGSIVDQTARYYVRHDGQGWHIRTTAKGARNFTGAIRVKDAKIKTYKSIGLEDGKQQHWPSAGGPLPCQLQNSENVNPLQARYRAAVRAAYNGRLAAANK